MRSKLLVIKFLTSFLFISQNLQGQLSTKDFVIKQFTIENGLPSNSVYACTIDSFGYLWFATDNGMSRFDGKHFRNFDESHGLLENMILGFWVEKGNIFGLGFKGASALKKKSFRYTIDKILLENRKNFRFRNSEEKLFYLINGNSELVVFHNENPIKVKFSDTSQLKHYFGDDFDILSQFKFHLINKHTIGRYSIIIADGNDEETEKIFLYTKGKAIDSLTIKSRASFYLSEDRKNVFIISPGIVSILGIVNNKLTIVQSIDLPGYNLNGFLQIKKNTYIVTTIDKGVFIFQKKLGFDSLVPAKYMDFADWLDINKLTRGVKCYESMGKDSIFVGTSHGVAPFDAKNGKIQDLFFHTRTYSLHALNSNQLYIGSINGLHLYDFSLKKTRKIDLGDASNSKINSIASDQQENIWVSTSGKGVYVLNKLFKVLKIYNTDRGLITNDVFKIQIDHRNRKWFSSNKGLQILENDKLFRVDKHDGLISDEVHDFELHGDTAWISTPAGKQSYRYQKHDARIKLPIYFNSYAVNNIAIDSLPSNLSPKDDKIEFNYIGIYYPNPDNIEYEYKLIKDKKETPWQRTKETKLIFEKLQAGEYELLIKAIHNNNPEVYSDLLSKRFYIKPYFYQTIWFYTLVMAMVLGTIFYYFYRKNRRKLKVLLYERELAKLKLEALKAEMNPHFIFNALNGIKEYMMQNDYDNSQYYLSQLAKLIRNSLQNSKQEMHSLEDEIAFNSLYIELEQMRFSFKFDFIKDISKLQSPHFEIPSMLLQPFFENAIRHGKIGQLEYQGKLYFAITETEDEIIIAIKDNGIGITKSKELYEKMNHGHKSLAMDIINERIDLYRNTQRIDIHIKINELKDDEYRTQILLIIKK